MTIKILICSFVFLLGISVGTHANELTHDSYGAIIFGKTLQATTHDQLDVSTSCQYVQLQDYPNIDLMIVDGMVKRLESNKTQLLKGTPFYGLVTGAINFETFRKTYPKIEIEEHEYENGFYLRWYNHAQTKAIVVDFINGKFDMVKAGVVPDVLFVEGCA